MTRYTGLSREITRSSQILKEKKITGVLGIMKKTGHIQLFNDGDGSAMTPRNREELGQERALLP